MRNKWKILFFLLLGLNIAVMFIFLILVKLPAKNESIEEISNKDPVTFNIQSNKEDLNKVINHYIEEEGLRGAIDYQVLLTDHVDLFGTMEFFGQDLDMQLSMAPKALDNGDLMLSLKSISIGQLELPGSYVLKFVRDRYKLPDWVIIQPNDEKVYVALQQMKLKSDLKVRVNEFDLKHDDIEFSLIVPTK